jgi:hypothetical protein
MVMGVYEKWVRDGQRVNGVYAVAPRGVHVTGRVIAYIDQPTVMILTDEGDIVSWNAALCVPAADHG